MFHYFMNFFASLQAFFINLISTNILLDNDTLPNKLIKSFIKSRIIYET